MWRQVPEKRSVIARTKLFVVVSLLLAPIAVLAQKTQADPVLAAMRQELDRSLRNFKSPSPGKDGAVAPYFLSYQLTDNRAVDVSASFGTLMSTSDRNTRVLDIDIRVGDYQLDNTHPLREQTSSMEEAEDRLEAPKMPLDDDPMALRVALWQATEQHYRRAVERLQQVQANVQVKVEQEDKSGDFSRQKPESYSEPIAAFSVDTTAWEQKLRNLTKPFGEHKEILGANANFTAEIETRRYVNRAGGPGL